MIRKAICFVLFLIISSAAYSIPDDETQKKNRDILLYGLESDIIPLLITLESDDERVFEEEIWRLFETTRSTTLRDAVINYYAHTKNKVITDFSLQLLSDPLDEKRSTVLAVIEYVSALKIQDAATSMRDLIESGTSEYRDQAIKALGILGDSEDALYLLDYLDSEIDTDEKTRLIIRQNVMAALGEIGAEESWERLNGIAGDEDENAYIRASAGIALGKIGKPESLSILLSMFAESDPVIRSAAVKAVSHYNTPESEALILEAFRDSYYKVRLEAIEAAETKKLQTAVPYLMYRAENDPEETVKLRSYDALAKIDNQETLQWLQQKFSDDKRSEKYRLKAASVLLEHHASVFFPSFEKTLIDALQTDKNKTFRNELIKLFQKNKHVHTARLASAFLDHSDPGIKSAGLDIYEKNTFPELKTTVEKIASDEKLGAVSRRAKKILGIQ